MMGADSDQDESLWVLAGQDGGQYCSIYSRPDDLVNPLRLRRGRSMGDTFPTGIEFKMASDVAGIQVPDVIANLVGYLMVSGRAKSLLEAEANTDIEFHRFTLLNHKGRVATEDVYIANVLRTEPCADSSRTEGMPSPRRQGEFMRIDRLAFDMARIPDDANMFRLGERPSIIVISDSIRRSMESAGLSAKYMAEGELIEL